MNHQDFSITVNKKIYSYNEIYSGDYKNDHLEEYYLKSLNFCRDWITGKENFTISTSGSTGTPKPIDISAKQMAISAGMTLNALGLKANDKALACLNIYFIAGMMMLVRGMVGGLKVYLVEPVSNPLLQIQPGWPQIHFVALVPLQLMTALSVPESRKRLSEIKSIIIGGAPLTAQLEDEIIHLPPAVYETYGMTETVSHIALKRLNGSTRSKYFQVFKEVEITTDSRECLMVRSELTNNEWLTTNDKVKLFDHNKFEWLGRVDHVINSGGIKFQIEPLEKKISQVFKKLNITRPFFIAGLPHNSLGEAVTLFIEGEDSEEIRKFLNNPFPTDLKKYELPKEIIFQKNFDRTPTGKIKRKEIIHKVLNQNSS